MVYALTNSDRPQYEAQVELSVCSLTHSLRACTKPRKIARLHSAWARLLEHTGAHILIVINDIDHFIISHAHWSLPGNCPKHNTVYKPPEKSRL